MSDPQAPRDAPREHVCSCGRPFTSMQALNRHRVEGVCYEPPPSPRDDPDGVLREGRAVGDRFGRSEPIPPPSPRDESPGAPPAHQCAFEVKVGSFSAFCIKHKGHGGTHRYEIDGTTAFEHAARDVAAIAPAPVAPTPRPGRTPDFLDGWLAARDAIAKWCESHARDAARKPDREKAAQYAAAIRSMIPPAAPAPTQGARCPDGTPGCQCQAPMDPAPAPTTEPWYEADGSVTMLPAEEVTMRRKLAAKVLAAARKAADAATQKVAYDLWVIPDAEFQALATALEAFATNDGDLYPAAPSPGIGDQTTINDKE